MRRWRPTYLRFIPSPYLIRPIHPRNLRLPRTPLLLLGHLGPVRVHLAAQDGPGRLAILSSSTHVEHQGQEVFSL